MFEGIYESAVSYVTWSSLLYGLLGFAVTFVVGSLVAGFVVVRMPADYFHHSRGREFMTDSHPALRWSGALVKNAAGALLVALGVLMVFIPGPGILTILLGVTLLDFPGKRRLELKLISRPEVLRGVNAIRARYGRPPLVLD
ncbi:MAG TPA: PGPGW domain-containing protein [Pyrinomonadaceae bacterium]